MKPLNEISCSGIWYMLCLFSLVLVVGTLASLIRSLRERRTKGAALLACFNLLLGFALFVVLMDCSMSVIPEGDTQRYYLSFEYMLFAQPWRLYGGLAVLSAGLLIATDAEYIRFHKKNLTPDAIRQTVNVLPEGIAVMDADGTIRLSNLRMNELCSELTGTVLSDGTRFLEQLRERGEQQNGQIFIHADSGRVWLFEDDVITVGHQEYRQIISKDVTEKYRIIEDLKEKNEHLKDLQRRMKAVSDLSADMFIGEEQARAKAALHNQLGQVLLMGQYYLNHPEKTDPELVCFTTRQMNRFLLGEAAEPDELPADALAEASALAGAIGVSVVLSGKEPQEAKMREMIAQAVTECAANTVKHAEGDCLTVRTEERGAKLVVTITNNGRPPKKPIVESGGLLSLRHKTEESGGSMTVSSTPVFMLTLEFPNPPKKT